MGLKIDAVISDLGGQNQAIWRLFDIHGGRFLKVKNSCTHPYSYDTSTPHVFKNLRDILTNGY
jgi:hypothetical protein